MSPLAVRRISGRILIVDDELANVRLLERILGIAGCPDRHWTTDPRQALDLCAAVRPDAVLLDLNMPHLDGIALLGLFQEQFPCRATMPILVLTADATVETKHRALQAGATDFLTKPLDALELILRLGNHLDVRRLHLEVVRSNELLETRVRERTADLEEAQAEIVERLSVATELRDDDTGGHVGRVAETTGRIAEALGLPEEEARAIRTAARLHDVGKVSVPDRILLKTGGLTDEESAVMRGHTTAGGSILRGSRFPTTILAEEIARCHHERWDGSGYPAGLSGERIPLSARIVAVADVYDGLTHDRHKSSWRVEAALAEVRRLSGSRFDPRVATAFLGLFEGVEERGPWAGRLAA